MTTVAHGPYEHVGAYAELGESERFDTSGTPDGFCGDCEHAPCVTGLHRYCELPPRAIVVWTIAQEITYNPLGWTPHLLPLMSATSGLAFAAIFAGGRDGEQALAALVQTRDRIREAVRKSAEVASS